MEVQLLVAGCGLAFVGAVVELLRRRQLREKYAALWLVTGMVVLPVAVFPGLFELVADALDVVDPVNLALFAAVVFLVFLGMHLSWELNRLEEETRALAEEVALLRMGSAPRDRRG